MYDDWYFNRDNNKSDVITEQMLVAYERTHKHTLEERERERKKTLSVFLGLDYWITLLFGIVFTSATRTLTHVITFIALLERVSFCFQAHVTSKNYTQASEQASNTLFFYIIYESGDFVNATTYVLCAMCVCIALRYIVTSQTYWMISMWKFNL